MKKRNTASGIANMRVSLDLTVIFKCEKRINSKLIHHHLKEYSFPNEEGIYSCAFNSDEGINDFDVVCGARPSLNAKAITPEEFWPSALFNCIEDMFLSELFSTLSQSTKPRLLNDFSIIEPYKLYLQDSYLKVGVVLSLYEMIDNKKIKAFMGNDNTGIFTIISSKNTY